MKSLFVSVILNYLKKQNKTKTASKTISKGKKKSFMNYEHGNPLPSEGMVSVEPSEMVCSITLLKPWLKFKYNRKIKQTTFLQQAATIK